MLMPGEAEGDLLRRFVHGDRDAFELLFRQFQGEVHRWIVRIVRDHSAADDALVETFWRAYRGRARFDPARSFGAWMRRIATNVARDSLKAARRRREWQVTDDRLASPAGRDAGLRESVVLAFRTLSPRLQIVALLALIEERPYAEIAGALDVPVGTVKSRVFRAIRALRVELTRLGIHP
jgi:RNA polymerase sigma-70 factor (ECF subfamily)